MINEASEKDMMMYEGIAQKLDDAIDARGGKEAEEGNGVPLNIFIKRNGIPYVIAAVRVAGDIYDKAAQVVTGRDPAPSGEGGMVN